MAAVATRPLDKKKKRKKIIRLGYATAIRNPQTGGCSSRKGAKQHKARTRKRKKIQVAKIENKIKRIKSGRARIRRARKQQSGRDNSKEDNRTGRTGRIIRAPNARRERQSLPPTKASRADNKQQVEREAK